VGNVSSTVVLAQALSFLGCMFDKDRINSVRTR